MGGRFASVQAENRWHMCWERGPFMACAFSVSPQVLIPRQETELLVERCIALIEKEGVVKALDLCTAAAVLPFGLALYSGAQIFASDLSAGALRVARQNAQRLGAEVRFMQADMLERMEGRYGSLSAIRPIFRMRNMRRWKRA